MNEYMYSYGSYVATSEYKALKTGYNYSTIFEILIRSGTCHFNMLKYENLCYK
jgi:hypothetical protein